MGICRMLILSFFSLQGNKTAGANLVQQVNANEWRIIGNRRKEYRREDTYPVTLDRWTTRGSAIH